MIAFSGIGPASAEDVPPAYPPPVVPIEQGPPQSDHLAAARYLHSRNKDLTPEGVNDFACRPSIDHPRPVVLAHGTDATAYTDWSAIGPLLAGAGFCVFALNYGGDPAENSYGTEDIWLSGYQLGDFVGQVLAATGAAKVDLVGFSQGANVTRYYTNKLGGAAVVGQWVGLASPSHGGVMYGLATAAETIPELYDYFELVASTAAIQQAAGSPFIRALNEAGDTVPGVRYTTISSKVDEMIQPFDSIALRGENAHNLVIQDLCPVNLSGHFHSVYEPFVQQLLLNTLDPARARPPSCVPVALGTGIPEVILSAHS